MIRLALYSFTLIFFANCASISTLQTGRVLDKDESQHSVGVATYSSDDFIGGASIGSPILEYTYRRGVWDKIDIGGKVTIIGSMNADLKYNLIDGESLALATGFGFGYLPFESSFGGQETKVTVLDLILPLYLSYDLSEMLTAYSAGKYLFRSISSDGIVMTANDGSMFSSTLGLQYGKSAGIFAEASFITGLDNDFSGTQFNFSYFFSF